MSTIKSNVDHLVFNADGASKDIKFQANGVEKASISSAGAFTSTTIDATKLTGSLPAIDGSSLTGLSSGLSEADQWRLHTSLTGSAEPITANLERADTDGFGKLGTGMSEASGVFTFPSTGYWLISMVAQVEITNDPASGISIQTTTNNSSYSIAARSLAGDRDASWVENSSSAEFLFDVTDTTTHKVRFATNDATSSSTLLGNSYYNYTYMTFIKLGDT